MPALWMHRPSDEEHEIVLKAQTEGGYPSVSAFIREAALRLAHSEDLSPAFTRVADAAARVEEAVKILQDISGEVGV